MAASEPELGSVAANTLRQLFARWMRKRHG